MATAAYLINRLPSDAVDAISYELWHNKALTNHDLKSLKPFGCLVHTYVPEARRKPLSKVDTQSTRGCFIGYLDTDTMHKIWDFERKCFVNSHDLTFEETQFPKPSDFDEPPADPYIPSQSPSPEQQPETHQIFDEITVLLPPALQV